MTKTSYSLKAEEELLFDLPDSGGLKIRGILRGSLDMPLAIVMHGRGGGPNNTIYFLLARYLAERGIASLRLAMYDHGENYRNLVDCTLQTHAHDFSVVVDELRERGVAKLFAVGHSYGGLTILMSDRQLEGAVLWDPSHGGWWMDNPKDDVEGPELKIGGVIINTDGRGYIHGQIARDFDIKLGDTTSLASGKGYPLMAITGTESIIRDYVRRYIDAAEDPKELVVIDGATHQMNDSDFVIDQLLFATHRWLADYS
jgi:hypothetical protein